MAESQPFKAYFGSELAALLAAKISAVQPAFAASSFVQQVEARYVPLELKARVALIATALRDHLPSDYPAALTILMRTLGPENPTEAGIMVR
jgi:hypothetical protein